MSEITGPRGFGIHSLPSEDLLKQIKLNQIKTKAGKIAYLVLHGEKAALGSIMNGVTKALGAIKWIDRVLEERTSE
jgi:hypothetical protein